jgi:hypothetical protein
MGNSSRQRPNPQRLPKNCPSLNATCKTSCSTSPLNITASNWEAANGQIRPFMESLLVDLGKRETSKVRSDPSAALQDLRDQEFIDKPEWQMIRGFWQGIQNNGPHQGLSYEQEALFRLHVATAIARYLIYKTRTGTGSP